jgi:hypothetical protein
MSHKVYRQDKNCLNCGAIVEEKFCPQCGQENIETHENFFSMVGHFVSDYLHFDSKFFRSLIPLFTKPGFLSMEYWEGRRVRYIHPLRLFFFIAIIFMIVTSLFYNKYGDTIKEQTIISTSPKYDEKTLSDMPQAERQQVNADKELEAEQIARFHHGIDLLFKIMNYVTFFFLPLYALVFKLLYIRRKSFYVDHLIYTVHLQSFAYLLFALLALLPLIFNIPIDFIVPTVFLAVFIYIIISLRAIYRQGWFKTILKALLATFSLVFVTTLGFVVVAAVDALVIQK